MSKSSSFPETATGGYKGEWITPKVRRSVLKVKNVAALDAFTLGYNERDSSFQNPTGESAPKKRRNTKPDSKGGGKADGDIKKYLVIENRTAAPPIEDFDTLPKKEVEEGAPTLDYHEWDSSFQNPAGESIPKKTANPKQESKKESKAGGNRKKYVEIGDLPAAPIEDFDVLPKMEVDEGAGAPTLDYGLFQNPRGERTPKKRRNTKQESKKESRANGNRKKYVEIGDLTAALIEDFDVLPEREVDEDLKYRAVRKKDERAQLKGWSCHMCRDYYEELAKDMHPSEVQRLMDKCSKHRSNNPTHYQSFTPPGLWDTTMPSTEEALEKGILKYVEASPPVRRKRHDLLD